MRYRIDRSVDALDGGRILLGGDPTRLMRLSAAGALVVRRWIVDGADRPTLSGAATALLDRLVDASMAHPVPLDDCAAIGPGTDGADDGRSEGDARVDRVTVIVPVKDRPDELRRCLAALVESGIRRVVVVDDGSADPAAHRAVAEAFGASLVARPVSGGPAAARMSGWAWWAQSAGDGSRADRHGSATGRHGSAAGRNGSGADTLVAFVDSDVVVSPDWLDALVPHVDDGRVALVAPRVVHAAGRSLVDRYERAESPLDLGSEPAAIRPGTRVAYVPAAALLVRAAAFAAVGGFDEDLDVGEDVDLLWRLHESGWICRYEPSSVVVHAGRSRLVDLLRRRVDYGRSAAVLDARHPGDVAPIRGSRWSAAVAAALVVGRPLGAAAATGVVAVNAATMARRLGDLPERQRIATRLVLRGHVGFLRQLARAVLRPWWPVALVVGAVHRPARRGLVAAVILSGVVDGADRLGASSATGASGAPWPLWFALRLMDDGAYSVGVWQGCLRLRRFGPLLPSVR